MENSSKNIGAPAIEISLEHETPDAKNTREIEDFLKSCSGRESLAYLRILIDIVETQLDKTEEHHKKEIDDLKKESLTKDSAIEALKLELSQAKAWKEKAVEVVNGMGDFEVHVKIPNPGNRYKRIYELQEIFDAVPELKKLVSPPNVERQGPSVSSGNDVNQVHGQPAIPGPSRQSLSEGPTNISEEVDVTSSNLTGIADLVITTEIATNEILGDGIVEDHTAVRSDKMDETNPME